MTYLDLYIALKKICENDEETKGTIFENVSQFDEINEITDLEELFKFAKSFD